MNTIDNIPTMADITIYVGDKKFMKPLAFEKYIGIVPIQENTIDINNIVVRPAKIFNNDFILQLSYRSQI